MGMHKLFNDDYSDIADEFKIKPCKPGAHFWLYRASGKKEDRYCDNCGKDWQPKQKDGE